MERPDLTHIDPKIIAYIEYLENQLKPAQPVRRSIEAPVKFDETPMPAEPTTTINILTSSLLGFAKRTHRHHYTPQHRSGMGIFDLDTDPPDYPAVLASVDDSQNLLMFTNKARVFRQVLSKIPDLPVRCKGEFMLDRLPLDQDEQIKVILPERSTGYVAMISEKGRIRVLRHHMFGEHMKAGTSMYPYSDYGPLAGACWTNGDGDLLVVTEHGIAIRFSEKLITPQGDWAIRLNPDDKACGVTPVYADSVIIVLGSDGKGTTRSMTGFLPNKSLGGNGKQLFKNEHVIGAATVADTDHVFMISRLGKIIRFRSDEVPLNEGVVQGVICMSLRNDEVSTFTISPAR